MYRNNQPLEWPEAHDPAWLVEPTKSILRDAFFGALPVTGMLTASAGDVSVLGLPLQLNAGVLYGRTAVGGDLRVHLVSGSLTAS